MKRVLVFSISAAVFVAAVVLLDRYFGGAEDLVDGVQDRAISLVDRGLETTEINSGEREIEIAAPELERPYASEEFERGDYLLTSEQMAAAGNVAETIGIPPETLAAIAEDELGKLDDGELERDLVFAQSGVDVSMGIAQVKVSTAEYVADVVNSRYPELAEILEKVGREELVKRLDHDEWNLLYAGGYLIILDSGAKDYVAAGIKYPGHAGPVTELDRETFMNDGPGRFYYDLAEKFRSAK